MITIKATIDRRIPKRASFKEAVDLANKLNCMIYFEYPIYSLNYGFVAKPTPFADKQVDELLEQYRQIESRRFRV